MHDLPVFYVGERESRVLFDKATAYYKSFDDPEAISDEFLVGAGREAPAYVTVRAWYNTI